MTSTPAYTAHHRCLRSRPPDSARRTELGIVGAVHCQNQGTVDKARESQRGRNVDYIAVLFRIAKGPGLMIQFPDPAPAP